MASPGPTATTTFPSIPLLQPRLILGYKPGIRNDVHFSGDEDVLYPVGGVVAIQNFMERRQRLIKLGDKAQNVNYIAIAPNRKTLAVAETGDKPVINLFDIPSLKKKKQLTVEKDNGAREFVCMAFTMNNKTLIAVTGEPEWAMYVFKCERGKIESSTRANNPNQTGTVYAIAPNPNDVNTVVTIGNNVLRIMACSEGLWKQYGFSRADNINFVSGGWLSQDRLIAGTNDARLYYFESGELRACFWVGNLPIMNIHMGDELKESSSQITIPDVGPQEEGQDYSVKSLITFPKGFAFGYTSGFVLLYEKDPTNPHVYRKRNIFRIPKHQAQQEDPTMIGEEKEDLNVINTISISPQQDILMVSCRQSQIYSVRLWGPNLDSNPEIMFQEVGPKLHHGAIGGLAVCQWKPIFLTTGEHDRTIRVWNYEDEVLIICKEYQEDVYSAALHPTGLYAIVGFADKFRFLTLLLDDLSVTRDFPIRNCTECCFSNLGHYFAAANGSIIQVYSTVTFENIFNLKGHISKINQISWNLKDMKMSSCGSEGAIYEWQVSTAKRIQEVIVKHQVFTGINITSDGKTSYVVGEDGELKEVSNSVVQRQALIVAGGLDCICLSRSDLMCFVSGNNGIMYSVKLPIGESSAEFIPFFVHTNKVTRMKVSFDDRFVISVDVTGTIVVWKITNTEGKGIKMDKDFSISTDVLLTKEDFDGKMDYIRQLQVRMHELETEHAYQMRQNENAHVLMMKEIHEGYSQAIDELKEKNETLEAEHTQEIQNINVEISKMKANHQTFIHKLEANYNEKLIFEYDKYLRLEEKMENMRRKYEKELDDLRNAKLDSENSITKNFMQQLGEKEIQIEELQVEMGEKTREHEVIKQQIEDDADKEIYDLKTKHETLLREEQESNIRLRGESGILKKKLVQSNKTIEDLNHEVHVMQQEQGKLKNVIITLERDITGLKTEITERDSTIQDKERRIFELKHRNEELEKFKFVLEFKIDELKSRIEPREAKIREQTEQINEMIRELESLQKVIMSLELQLAELREKLNSADKELRREIRKFRKAKACLKTIRTDIAAASGFIQDEPKLKQAVRDMYHKYSADRDFEIIMGEDADSKNEFLRQRDVLERTVKGLQTAVAKNYSGGGIEKNRLVDENAALIVEANALRKELKTIQRKNKQMESVLGLASASITSKQAQRRLDDAIKSKEDVHIHYKKIIEEDKSTIEELQNENMRLQNKIMHGKDNPPYVPETTETVDVQPDDDDEL